MKITKRLFFGCILICTTFLYMFYLYIQKITLLKKINYEKILINLNEFDYLIGQNCSYNHTSFIVIVTSFAANIDARNAIRNAYKKSELNRLKVVRIFLLAALRKGQSKISQEDIKQENLIYGDILQGNFYESYRNLTYKHIMGLKWASLCKGVDYIIKMDDDIAVDFYKVVKLINENKRKENISLMGYVLESQRVVRDVKSKWYVSKQKYSPDVYPTFLSGWLYITTPRVASLLVDASDNVPFFWIDDVYITGILARNANISHQNINSFIAPFTEFLMCCIQDKLSCNYIAGPTNGYYAFHGLFKKLTEKCLKGLCRSIPHGKTMKDYCTVSWKFPVDIGRAEVKNIYV